MKKTVKKAIKLIVFISLVNLPFITITQLTGIDTFLDSFENPNFYHYFKGDGHSMEPNIKDGDYIILQKSSHPDFSIEKGDIILYCKDNGETVCHRVYHVNCIGPVKKYHTLGDNNKFTDKPIDENQIIGKVVSNIDNNLWSSISMKTWDLSIHKLNVNALFTNH